MGRRDVAGRGPPRAGLRRCRRAGRAREEERDEGDGGGEVEPEGEGGGEREGAGRGRRPRPRRGCVGRRAFIERSVRGGGGIGRRHCWIGLLAGAAWRGDGSVQWGSGQSGQSGKRVFADPVPRK